MTRIAIVEDEAAVREQLTGYVQRYTRQYGTPVIKEPKVPKPTAGAA